MNEAQLENLLGAFALALADAQTQALQQASGLSNAGCTVLNALAQYPGLTIRELAAIAGLSHSVMVRTLDALVGAGLAYRQAGQDRREVQARLSPAGEAQRERLIAARAAVLTCALEAVPVAQRDGLQLALEAMLAALTTGRQQADHLCRFCDESACGAACPVEAKARQLTAGEA
ncbi:MarR family winged helix-turn-helix transcriptional regulator [Pseudomonas oryzihabitans]|uniref:MarR family winged helix-turn-helix transcriptional regulator n=1 Tax=Pseudomonas oryzihabitans TaxID=47885 RepID=UPI0028637ECF|nr:MarR family transcriptional regulator [Pseudomonas psychrotolerans]MDR6679207.1 DNA-binding MarR family transcriptional regulator [Pseudomonas psychrotolerans]